MVAVRGGACGGRGLVMKLNPNALVMWGLFAGVGYLVGGAHGALIGLVAGLGVSFFVNMLL